jgi:hypothetical protein
LEHSLLDHAAQDEHFILEFEKLAVKGFSWRE